MHPPSTAFLEADQDATGPFNQIRDHSIRWGSLVPPPVRHSLWSLLCADPVWDHTSCALWKSLPANKQLMATVWDITAACMKQAAVSLCKWGWRGAHLAALHPTWPQQLYFHRQPIIQRCEECKLSQSEPEELQAQHTLLQSVEILNSCWLCVWDSDRIFRAVVPNLWCTMYCFSRG